MRIWGPVLACALVLGCADDFNSMDLPEGLAINEMNAGTGPDFIEFVNSGEVNILLRDFKFTDDNKDAAGTPNIAHVTRFPTNLILAPGEHFVAVEVKGANFRDGIVTGAECLLPGVSRCMHIRFGLSNTNGDSVYLFNELNEMLLSEIYPAAAAADGLSWCLVPDALGSFSACQMTPGEANTPEL